MACQRKLLAASWIPTARRAGGLPGLVPRVEGTPAPESDVSESVSESGSEFESIQNPSRYVAQTATNRDVSVGQMKFDPKADKSWVPGTVDKTYGIEPTDRKRVYARANISNFMYLLEADSPFVVVTKAELKQIDKVKPEEFATNRWTFKLEITSRTPKEE